MNYRHAYHAGNFADVVKHLLLMAAMETLAAKEKPFFVLDTHAGIGFYDLAGDEAGKTGEWGEGIGRIASATGPVPPVVERYLAVVRASNPDGGLRFYPGSPEVVRRMMREADRLVLRELHPKDAELLAESIGADSRVSLEASDGYAALKALLPPKERRGLVLIDPPYERTDEFAAVLRALSAGLSRWAAGTYAIWYPIKERKETDAFVASLGETVRRDAPTTKLWVAEMLIRAADDATRLNGCGMAFVNPPWGVTKISDQEARFLVDTLAQGDGEGWDARWIVGTE